MDLDASIQNGLWRITSVLRTRPGCAICLACAPVVNKCWDFSSFRWNKTFTWTFEKFSSFRAYPWITRHLAWDKRVLLIMCRVKLDFIVPFSFSYWYKYMPPVETSFQCIHAWNTAHFLQLLFSCLFFFNLCFQE